MITNIVTYKFTINNNKSFSHHEQTHERYVNNINVTMYSIKENYNRVFEI